MKAKPAPSFFRQRHDGSSPSRGLPDQPARQLPVDDRQVQVAIDLLRRRLRATEAQP